MSNVRRMSGGVPLAILAIAVLACSGQQPASAANPAESPGRNTPQGPVLRLATTTSTDDSGLLAALLPDFEKQCGCRVDVIAVGSGQAIEIGRNGDADVVLSHDRKAEDQFVAERHARERFDVMYNDFVIVGPAADPARVAGMSIARDAFAAVARAGARFVSRGDRSGTHSAELATWAALGMTPSGLWYRAVGQGMGETLVAANEQQGYTLTDRATFVVMAPRLPGLRLLVGGSSLPDNPDRSLRNFYGVMAVNPDTHPDVNAVAASRFVDWILSVPTQRAIADFGVARFGQPLFYPDSDQYKASRQIEGTVAGPKVMLPKPL